MPVGELYAIVLAVFYAVAMAVLILFGANLAFLAVQFSRRDRLLDGPVPDLDATPSLPARLPNVTVQIPLFNERFVARRVIDACARLDYPSELLEIQVLDDSVDDTVEIVAERVRQWRRRGVNVSHIHRTDRSGFKAGALANGLRSARGDLVAVFDADFVPLRDWLTRVIPHFDQPDVGMVQTRWGHRNLARSFLTRVQAANLDAHFAIQQRARNLLGLFINFNGTAGIWRRACIADAGGWQGDTLTEDLDLSYRAQLSGWKLHYVHEIEVPAELPTTVAALRKQQFRWTKGGMETSTKLLHRLWSSVQPLSVKLEGTLHLTNHALYPFLLLAVACHAPLVYLRSVGRGPDELYFGLLGLGLIAFTGVVLEQVFAQRSLYPNWLNRLRILPAYMAVSIGLSANNSVAMIQGLAGVRTPFIRTPKFSEPTEGSEPSPGYGRVRFEVINVVELLLLVYSLFGLYLTIRAREWAAVSFQALFVVGFLLIVGLSLLELFRSRSVSVSSPTIIAAPE